ncbi:MAG: insulinase family protein, partial [Mogibacterium sp.]|nr:insulinase family protein [Mogibacterium sp.]
MDVYLDAVLHPLSVSDPHAFRQEGWHYELEEPDGELICNGVVYNEMKGAFASPDEIMQSEMNRLLFPDNCYGYESGGHPDHIPELTYENYLESHRTYYHPSNARINLDGSVDLDAVLDKISSFLEPYDPIAVDSEIPIQQPVSPEEEECLYEVSDDGEDKLILADGWVYGDFRDREKTFAFNILSEVLAGSNEAPLTRQVLEQGLAMDLDFQALDGIQQPYLALILRNVPEDKRGIARDAVRKIFAQIAEDGIDRSRLHAALNRLEFLTREKDYGTMPRGLVFAMESLDSWLYGGNPAQNLQSGEIFRSLREKAETGYFEDLIRTCILENPHHAQLVLIPSKTLGAEKLEREKARLAAVKQSWSGEEIDRVIREFEALRRKQSVRDSEEQLRSLPQLALSDVPEQVRETASETLEIDGVKVIHPLVNTGGILYLDLYFDLSDLTVEELQQTKFLASLLGDIATTNYDVNSLQTEIDANLGRLKATVSAIAPLGVTDRAVPMLMLNTALLPDRKAEAVRLLREVLLESVFTDQNYLFNEIRQSRISMEQSVVQGGNSYARQRVSSYFSVLGALSEALGGIEILRWVQKLEDRFGEDGQEFCAKLTELAGRVFSRDRVTIGLTGPMDEAWIREVLGILYEKPMGEAVRYAIPEGPVNEGFRIPVAVSFTAKGSNLYALGGAYHGTDSVASQILTYGYLWNTIRVQGGAYGTGLRMSLAGEAL